MRWGVLGIAWVCLAVAAAGCVEAAPFVASDAGGNDAPAADTTPDTEADSGEPDADATGPDTDADADADADADTTGPDTDTGNILDPCDGACVTDESYCDGSVCVPWPATTLETALLDCQAISEAYGALEEGGHDAVVKLLSGDGWFIDPDGPGGSPAFPNYCEFDTLGGGWTRIWYQDEPNETEMAGWFGDETKSQHAAELLKREMLEVMAAYQDKSAGDAVQLDSMVRFALPEGWSQIGSGSSTTVWRTMVFETEESKRSNHRSLHFGTGKSGQVCGPITEPGEAGDESFGAFCIEGTNAPFYTGFTSPDADQCGTSSAPVSAADTCQTRRFALFVRVGCGDPGDPMCIDADLDGKKPIEGDCHDDNFGVYPGSTEQCALGAEGTPLDEDCDGGIDEPDANGCIVYHLDADLDSYAPDDSAETACLCGPNGVTGFQIAADAVTSFGDCNDDDSAVNPGAYEVCDGVDNNCNGATDEGFEHVVGDPCDGEDDDECATGTWTCTGDAFGVECVNEDKEFEESCEGFEDEDCDGDVDEANAYGCSDYYLDGDADGDGDAVEVQVQCLCGPDEESKYTATEAEDCDDDNPDISSGKQEICGDEVDSNCDGDVDAQDAVGCVDYRPDVDNDGYGDQASDPTCLCAPDAVQKLTAETGGDCDDDDQAIKPGADELCDGVDNDCDGKTDSDDPDLGSSYDENAYCDNMNGVCDDAKKPLSACVEGAWLEDVCGYDEYVATPSNEYYPYEPGEELSCDFADNNCNGQVDEDFKTNGVYDSFEHCGTCGASCEGIPGAEEVECQVNGDSASCQVLACETGFILEDGGGCTPWPLLTVDCSATTDEAAGLYKYLDAPDDPQNPDGDDIPDALAKAAELGGAVIEVKACLGLPYGPAVIETPVVLRGKAGGPRPKIASTTLAPALKVAASDVIVEFLEFTGGTPVVDVLKESGSLENIVLRDLFIHAPSSQSDALMHAPRIGLRVTAAANVSVEDVVIQSVAALPYKGTFWCNPVVCYVDQDWAPMAFGVLVEGVFGLTLQDVSVSDIAVNGDAGVCAGEDWSVAEGVGQPDVGDDNRGWASGIRILGSQGVHLVGVEISDVIGLQGEDMSCALATEGGGGGHATGLEFIDTSGAVVDNLSVDGVSSGAGGAANQICGESGPAGEARGIWAHGDWSSMVDFNWVQVSNITGGDTVLSDTSEPGGHAYGVHIETKATANFEHLRVTNIGAGLGGVQCAAAPSNHGLAAGLHITSDEGGLVDHATIVQVSSPGESAGIAFGQTVNKGGADVPTTVRNSILANTGTWGLGAVMGGWGEISYSLVTGADVLVDESVDMGNGMLMGQPPRFVKSGSGNFHLQPISPAIDTGDPESDFDNEPEPNGGRVNMGYYGNTDEAGLAPGASKTDLDAPCAESVFWFVGASGGGLCGCMSLVEGDPAPSSNCGVGLCEGGSVECPEGGTVCSTSGLAEDETCNDIDDDCDDNTDEGFAEIADVCNGIDDDCNGVIDDDFAALLGEGCDSPDADSCLDGELACAPVDDHTNPVEWVNGLNTTVQGYTLTASGGDGDANSNDIYANSLVPLWGDGTLDFAVPYATTGLVGLATKVDENGVDPTANTFGWLGPAGAFQVFVSVDNATVPSGFDSVKVKTYRIERKGDEILFWLKHIDENSDFVLIHNAPFAANAGPLYPFVEFNVANKVVSNAFLTQPYVCQDDEEQSFDEVCDQADNDCDDLIDEDFLDLEELCNGIDDNCNGVVDEGYEQVGLACDAADANACLDDTLVCGDPYPSVEPVQWVEGVNVSIVGNSIAESDSDGNYMTDDSYAHGLDPIWADGFFEFQFGLGLNGLCGLSAQPTVNPNAGGVWDTKTSVEFAFEAKQGAVFVNGIEVATVGEWWAQDTLYRIERIGSTLVFSVGYAGGDLVELWTHDSFVPGGGPLYPDVALTQTNSSVTHAFIWQPYVCEDDGDQELVELCTGLDEDCDGEFDEGFVMETLGAPEDEDSEIGEPCGVGECVGGTVVCDSETATTCSSYDQAADELCNGLDDDCDGETDESGACPEVEELSAGNSFTCALITDGSVRCWGSGSDGQLGPNTPVTNYATQGVQVPLPDGVGALQIAAGSNHACALVTGGKIYCWGDGASQQLGFSAGTNDSNTPVLVDKTDSGEMIATTVVAGGERTCAIEADKTVWCWGESIHFELGPDGWEPNYPATQIKTQSLEPALANVVEVAVGDHHVCARQAAGAVYCWGDNSSFQLGAGQVEIGGISASPRLVVDASETAITATAISAGATSSCAIVAQGKVMCWGGDSEGELGDSAFHTDGKSYAAVFVTDDGPDTLLSGATALASGSHHSCAVTPDGPRCWGRNSTSQLGQVSLPSYDTAQPPVFLDAPALGITAGDLHTCVNDEDGKAQCWGHNTLGQLGNGLVHNDSVLLPVVVQGLENLTTAIGVGDGHTCALAAGQIYCWGAATYGQLGNGADEDMIHAKPYEPVQLLGGAPMDAWWSDLSVNSSFACGIGGLQDQVYCWGQGTSGQVGDPEKEYVNPVALLVSGVGGAQTLATGEDHACAAIESWSSAEGEVYGDGVYCWGENTYGQLGDGAGAGIGPWTGLEETTPVFAIGTEGVTTVDAGSDHTCAIVGDQVHCWGYNKFGQLGASENVILTNDISAEAITVVTSNDVALSGMDLLAVGGSFSCAAKSGTKEVYCWGANAYGQIGIGNLMIVPAQATKIPEMSIGAGVTHLTAGNHHACFATAAGVVKCWGRGDGGQLGIGSEVHKTIPTKVATIAAPDGSGVTIHALQAGPANTCAMVEGVHPGAGMEMMCWGQNGSGEVGNGAHSSATATIVDLDF
jgi:alpha-tubulin suppressor-like RCC1 family protein